MNEHTPDLVKVLIDRLEQSSEVIEDLVAVFAIIDNNYDVNIRMPYTYSEM